MYKKLSSGLIGLGLLFLLLSNVSPTSVAGIFRVLALVILFESTGSSQLTSSAAVYIVEKILLKGIVFSYFRF